MFRTNATLFLQIKIKISCMFRLVR